MFTNRRKGALRPLPSAVLSAVAWQAQSSSVTRPASRAAANIASGRSSGVPCGPRVSAS